MSTMNGDSSALDKLSAHIARAIVQQIATVSASGQASPAACKLDLRGYIDGDVSSSIDFVNNHPYQIWRRILRSSEVFGLLTRCLYRAVLIFCH
jgi:hypothetical protein